MSRKQWRLKLGRGSEASYNNCSSFHLRQTTQVKPQHLSDAAHFPRIPHKEAEEEKVTARTNITHPPSVTIFPSPHPLLHASAFRAPNLPYLWMIMPVMLRRRRTCSQESRHQNRTPLGSRLWPMQESASENSR